MTDRLDAALKRHFARQNISDDAASHIMTRLAGHLPPQRRSRWPRLPTVLLDWQFAPAWPRLAALAGCALLGFAITAVSLERSAGAQRGNDITVAVFEPEALTGLRP